MSAAQSNPSPLRGMPEGAAIALEGRLQVLIEDHPNGRSSTRHFLQTEEGRVELALKDRTLAGAPGARVRLRGRVQGEMLSLDGTTSSVQNTSQAALPAALGEQRVAVILVNFQDDASQPITRDAAHALVFNTVDSFFRQSSFGQTWLAGNTFNWVTVPYSKTTCVDGMLLAAEADKAVAAAGGDLSRYNRKVYMFPKNACSWTGLALVNENPSMAWINGSFTLKAIGHELGHNLGLRHAHALDCDVSPTGDTCTRLPYGDAADLMGNVRTGDFSPYAKERLGWLNDGISPPILTADRSGRYTIEPYGTSSVGAKAIRIPRGLNSSGRMQWFYLENRAGVGLDSVLGGVGNLAQGVMFRTVIEGDGDSIHQIDMTPASAIGSTADLADGALTVGRSYTDPLSGAVVSVASVTTAGAVVDVTLPGDATTSPDPSTVCTRAAPGVSVSSVYGADGAGGTVRYSVTVANVDSTACGQTTFSLAANAPANWSRALGLASVTLSPGASITTTLDVTSSADAAVDTYGIGIGASSSAGSVHTASAGSTYTVQLPPGLVKIGLGTDKSDYQCGETVFISAKVAKGGVGVSGAAVVFDITTPDGRTASQSTATGSDGFARITLATGSVSTCAGRYMVASTVSVKGHVSANVAEFTVR